MTVEAAQVPGTVVHSESITALAASFAVAQGQIDDAKAKAENDFFKSRYADLSMVREVIRKPFSDNGLSVTQFPTTEAAGERTRVVVTTMIMHSSGEWMRSSIAIACRGSAHEIGSAITYARRYALSAMAGVCVDQDDDGNAASAVNGTGHAAANGTPPKPAPPKQPPPADLSSQEYAAMKAAITNARSLEELSAAGKLLRTSQHLTKEQRERLVLLGTEAKAELEQRAAEVAGQQA